MEKDVLSEADLAALKKKLDAMSMTAIIDFYHAVYLRCKLDKRVPKARDIQELVQVWKQVRRW